MKRQSCLISSDSDSDEIDLSKIKSRYGIATKKNKKEETIKKSKVVKNDEKQMTLFAAFSNINPSTKKSESKLNTSIKESSLKKIKVAPEDFFSTSKINRGNYETNDSNLTITSPSNIESNINSDIKLFVLDKSIKNKELITDFESHTINSNISPKIVSYNTNDIKSIVLKNENESKKEVSEIKISPVKEEIKNVPDKIKTLFSQFLPTDNHKILEAKSIIKTAPVETISVKPSSSTPLTSNPIIPPQEKKDPSNRCSTLFVDKYSPTTLNKIVGQHGDTSPANKLLAWLKNFDKNYKLNFKSEVEGSRFRAVLLSGPPGVGKTTTAKLVCQELGYFAVELNASSMRSKSSLNRIVTDSTNGQSFYQNQGRKHCIIMDEVDGMAGNEDRGGINELIQIIKTTKHPIICICNDRQSRKLQSFVKYVYDLRYRPLSVDQIKATILSISFKEKIKLPSDALNYIIKASNYDMRQVIHNLQMWSVGSLENETLKNDAKNAQKEFKLGPFDVAAKVFSHEGVSTLSEKSELFFQDYQLGGLFVQENYIHARPYAAKGNTKETMRLMSIAADSIALGDVLSAKIATTNNWTLLPTQAMCSSVIPGEYLHGRLSSRIDFPSYLGKLSKTNKNSRILSSLTSHLSLSTKGGVFHPNTLSMDYGYVLVKRFITPLKEGDIETVLMTLNRFQLLKDDMDLLVEATAWPHLPNPFSLVTPQLKASLTRAYNKAACQLPYAITSTKKMSIVSEVVHDVEDGVEEEIIDGDEEKENESLEADVMISKKKQSRTLLKTEEKSSAAPKARKPAAKKTSEVKAPKEKKVATKRQKK